MYDVVIIGSGPAGLSAAVYLTRAGLSIIVLEKEYEGTGQIANSGRVDNYLGSYGISGFDLGETFRAHAVNMGVPFAEAEVTAITKEGDVFHLNLNGKESIQSKTVLLATGASPKRSGIKGEEKFLGKGLSYCAICDGAFYKNKEVAVLGGGDLALDDALYLSDIASKVYLIHRRKDFRGAASTLAKLKEKANVEILRQERVEEIYGDDRIEKIVLESKREIPVSGVFIGFGSKPNTDLVKDLLPLDDRGYVIAAEDGITDYPGIFAAGDVRTKQLRQVVTAVSDGAYVSDTIVSYLRE